MKVQVYSKDGELTSRIKEQEIFSDVDVLDQFSEINKNVDVLILSDDIIQYTDLTSIFVNDNQHVFYLLHHHYEGNLEKSVKAICDSRDFVMIPPRLTVKQIIESILEFINPDVDYQTNVISFFSPLSNVGTTSTCLSVAKSLQRHSKAKIGVLLLNAWDDGTDQLNYKGKYLDEIRGQLSNKLVDNDSEFLSLFHMEEKDRYYILGGNRNTKVERLYTKDEIHYLIERAKTVFDVVLIDSGSHFDNANIVQSLKESDFRFMIVNQQYKAIKKFTFVFNDILYPLGYTLNDFMLIINQYDDKAYLPSTKDIHNELKVPYLTTIMKTLHGATAEGDRLTLYDYEDDNSSYRESINQIAKSVASRINIELSFDMKKKRKGLLSIIGS